MFSGKRPFLRPILLIILAAFFLTGCAAADNTNWPGLSTDGSTIYVAAGSQVLAYDADSQQLQWAFPQEAGTVQFYADPSVVNGRLIIGDYGVPGGFFNPNITVTLYGVDVSGSTPQIIWSDSELAEDRYVAPVLQDGDRAFVGTADNQVLAVDANTGEPLWSAPFITGHSVWGQPNLFEDVLYVSSLDRSVHALEAESGTEVAKWELEGALASRTVIGEGLLYVSSFDGALHALNLADESEAWEAPAADWIWGAPALADNTLVYADVQGNVYAVDARSGSALWQTQVSGAVQTRPVIVEGTVYIASEGDLETEQGQLSALALADGAVLWQQNTPAPLYTTPVVVEDGTVVVAMQSETALLVGFDPEAGSQRWVISPPAN